MDSQTWTNAISAINIALTSNYTATRLYQLALESNDDVHNSRAYYNNYKTYATAAAQYSKQLGLDVTEDLSNRGLINLLIQLICIVPYDSVYNVAVWLTTSYSSDRDLFMNIREIFKQETSDNMVVVNELFAQYE